MPDQRNKEFKTYQDGLVEGRKEGARNEAIRRTTVHLRSLMNTLQLSLEDAFIALELPKSERHIYRKIFSKQLQKKITDKW